MTEDTGQMRDRIKTLQEERYKLITALRAIAAVKHPDEPYSALKMVARNALREIDTSAALGELPRDFLEAK